MSALLQRNTEYHLLSTTITTTQQLFLYHTLTPLLWALSHQSWSKNLKSQCFSKYTFGKSLSMQQLVTQESSLCCTVLCALVQFQKLSALPTFILRLNAMLQCFSYIMWEERGWPDHTVWKTSNSHTRVYKLVQGHKRTGKPTELVIGTRLHEQRQVSKTHTNHMWYWHWCPAGFLWPFRKWTVPLSKTRGTVLISQNQSQIQ